MVRKAKDETRRKRNQPRVSRVHAGRSHPLFLQLSIFSISTALYFKLLPSGFILLPVITIPYWSWPDSVGPTTSTAETGRTFNTNSIGLICFHGYGTTYHVLSSKIC